MNIDKLSKKQLRSLVLQQKGILKTTAVILENFYTGNVEYNDASLEKLADALNTETGRKKFETLNNQGKMKLKSNG